MITLNERLDSFDAFDERLGKRQSRKLANNTYADGSPGYIFWNGSLDTIRRALRTYLRKRLVSGVAVR